MFSSGLSMERTQSVISPGFTALGFVTLKFTAHGVHLGVQIVQVVEQHRFRNHGQLGRTEFQFAMMTQNHVLDQHAERGRKAGQRGQFLFDHRRCPW